MGTSVPLVTHMEDGVMLYHTVSGLESHALDVMFCLQTHKQPVTEYEAIREKAANQKRDIEKALTKFLAKTSETHNLFNTDDNTVFPCEYKSQLHLNFQNVKVR